MVSFAKMPDVEHAGDGRGARSDGIAITCAEQAHEFFWRQRRTPGRQSKREHRQHTKRLQQWGPLRAYWPYHDTSRSRIRRGRRTLSLACRNHRDARARKIRIHRRRARRRPFQRRKKTPCFSIFFSKLGRWHYYCVTEERFLESRQKSGLSTCVVETCALIGDISVTVENHACSKCWTSEKVIKAMNNCPCSRFELDTCRYGTPYRRPTVAASSGLRSCYTSCWRWFLHRTAHPTSGSRLCLYIDRQQ